MKTIVVMVSMVWGLAGIPCNTVAATKKEKPMMNQDCQLTPMQHSQEMIRALLDDIGKSYTHVGGGGISGIRQIATNTYMISISQEKRIDQITYKMSLEANCKITILEKTATSSSPGNK
jgi:hypothetical protein